MSAPPPPADEYQVSHLGLVRGAFRFDLVEAMILAGVFPKDVKIRKKDGGEWRPAPSVGVAANSISFASSSPLRQSSVTTALGIFGSLGLLLAALFITVAISSLVTRNKVSLSASSSAPAPAVVSQAAPPASLPVATPRSTASARPQSYSGSGSPLRTSPVTSGINLPSPAKRALAVSTPVAIQPPATTFRDASGQTYRVSNYDHQRLQQLRRNLDSEESFIEQQKSKLYQYGRDIDNARLSVNSYSQSSVNQFNAKIKGYNTQTDNVQASIDRFNRKVDEFNAELRRVGTPIR